jgi:taurine--2-oxoglutarate transaminase
MTEQKQAAEDIVGTTTRHTYGTWRLQRGWKPLHVVDAEGCFFIDAAGKRYLDFSSQLICSNLGHKNQAVIDAICDQARRLPYIGPGFTCDVRAELTRVLLEVFPQGLTKFFYGTSGTEANEAAIKIARLYTGKYKIVSRYRSYHGSTAGSLALTGDLRRWPAEPMGKIGGVIFAPDADPYRCPLGRKSAECGAACADYVDYMIRHEHNVAAIIVEPVVGTNGVLVPPDDYLPRLREIADRHDVLLIADEIMSGWGRTGEWFAVNHWKVRPDILTSAKGVTGAYAPLGVTATSQEIADYFDDHYFAHGHTYEAHPLTLAPGIAAVREYRRLGLVEGAKGKGEYLGKRLRELKEGHPCIGDVRGLGLFWAVEVVRDRVSKEPFYGQPDKLAGRPSPLDPVGAELMKRGVYLMNWLSHFVIAPPLIVSEQELDEGVNALDASLHILDAEVRG